MRFLILLLLPLMAMGATYKDTVYVDSRITGGNGTDSASAFQYLSDAATFFNGKNLTTGVDSGCWLISISGSGYVGYVEFAGFTTNVNCFVDVIVHSNWRHVGVYDTTKFYIKSTTTNHTIVSNCRINFYYMQIFQMQTSSYRYGIRLNDVMCAHTIIKSCIFHDTSHTSDRSAIFAGAGMAPVFIVNNIFYGSYRTISIASATNDTNYIYNNTIVKPNFIGIASTYKKTKITNNIIYDTIGTDIDPSVLVDGSTNNAISALSPTCSDCQSLYDINDTLIFNDPANFDFRLKNGSVKTIGLGFDLSEDSRFQFDDDIVDSTRDANWDIGAYECIGCSSGTYVPTGATIILNTITPSRCNVTGGDTIWLTGDSLLNATVTVNGESATVIHQTQKVIKFITPAMTEGTYYVSASSLGLNPDSVLFVYESVRTSDTIYVDTVIISDSLLTYNPSLRADGGNRKCYKTIQMAVDRMIAGRSNVIIRGARYNECVTLPYDKNGTSWVDGRYNVIESYSNERAIIDASGTGSSYAIGIHSDNVVTRSVKYWIFKNLEIMGSRSVEGESSYGLTFPKGPVIVDSCIIHDNYATESSGQINGGITGYGWELCVVQNCVFYNNGSSIERNDNFADICVYSDYGYFDDDIDVGFVYDTGTHTRSRNIFRNNYFKQADFANVGIFGKAGQFFAGQNLDGAQYNYDYASFGDEIYNNIFENRTTGIRWPTYFAQIHNNILIDCNIGITINPSYMIQGMCIYNNTGIRCSTSVVTVANSTFAKDYTTNYERNLFVWILNNISDSSGFQNTYNVEEFAAIRTTGDETAVYDSTYVKNNYSWNPVVHVNDPTGENFYMERENRYTTEAYAKGTNYLNAYNAENELWASTGVADSDHVVSGSVTITNGGTGGAHPYLPLTLPSYLGAGWDWQDDVLALDDTVETPITEPPEIDSVSPLKIRPDSAFTIYHPAAGLVDSVKMNNVKIENIEKFVDSTQVTVPSWMPRGYYSDSVFTSGGAAACYHCSRVIIPSLDTVLIGVQP